MYPWESETVELISPQSLTESQLFPFGSEVGDNHVEVNSEDGNSPYITPPMGLPFIGKLYSRVFVSIKSHSINSNIDNVVPYRNIVMTMCDGYKLLYHLYVYTYKSYIRVSVYCTILLDWEVY